MDADTLSVSSNVTTPSDAPLAANLGRAAIRTNSQQRQQQQQQPQIRTTSSSLMPQMTSPPPLARTASNSYTPMAPTFLPTSSSPLNSYHQGSPSYSNIGGTSALGQPPLTYPQSPTNIQPTAALRKRNRDAWDTRIREQVWYFDSHSAAHPRNNPSAPQEDAIDSFAQGQDFGAADLSKRTAKDGIIGGGLGTDSTHLGGAIMVAGESGRQAEAGTQSMYGSSADACVATVITTADLAKLIPFPDEAMMLRATLPSLRQLEKHATQLLGHIRREIEGQVQDAGVSYANTNAKAAKGEAFGGHRSRKGQLGSQSISDLRKGLAERTLETTNGANGGTLTSVTLDDRGRMHVKPGTTFTGRTELTFSGGSSIGKGPAHYFDPLASRSALSTDSASFGKKDKLPFTGVTGYTLYDEQAKASSASLLTLGEEIQRRHDTFDTINASVQYHSPLAAAGPWTRELDIATKGLGPIAHQQIVSRQRQVERDRKELLRQVAEGLRGGSSGGGDGFMSLDQYEAGAGGGGGPSFGSNSYNGAGTSFAYGSFSANIPQNSSNANYTGSGGAGGGFGAGSFAYTVTPQSGGAGFNGGMAGYNANTNNNIYQSFSDDQPTSSVANMSMFNNNQGYYVSNTSFAPSGAGYSFAGGPGARQPVMGSDTSSHSQTVLSPTLPSASMTGR